MSNRVELTVTGQKALEDALGKFQEQVSDLRAPFTALATQVLPKIFARRFADSGPGWAPLNKEYAAWKAKHYPGQGILVRTGKMRTAFSGGLGQEFVVTKTSLEIDPSHAAPYWGYHQAGAGKLPARPIVVLNEVDLQTVRGFVATYIHDAGLALGFKVSGGGP